MNDEIAVGDLNSAARGSGARANKGKPQWWQLPITVIATLEDLYVPHPSCGVGGVMFDLGQWQLGSNRHLYFAMAGLLDMLAEEQGTVRAPSDRLTRTYAVPLRALKSTVDVLEFGAKKYPATKEGILDSQGRPTPAAAGNWAKGMPWSVCLSCALSHLFAAAGGEKNDAESGLSHLAHAMCNLIFLAHYAEAYVEGDDRIKQLRYTPVPFGGEDELNPYDRVSGITPLYRGVDAITGDHA